ncbi:MAG: ATP-binding protein [Lachnospiraceae bacterium]|nr:ATP-binding protein [Lachnospiraceae bacterium]
MIVLFGNFIGKYKDNIISESASHLAEISAQIKIYVEEKIKSDWKVAKSISNGMKTYSPEDSDRLMELLQTERDIWNISDIYVYTENGFSISADGDMKNNDVVSELVYNAEKFGRYMNIVRSTVTYTIPIETDVTLNDSRIVALSVVQDLDTFIDNMGLSSFDGTSCVFLTQCNGSKISQLTTTGAPNLYNAFSLFDGKTIRCLNQKDFVYDGELPDKDAYTFLLENEQSSEYVVTTPIRTDSGVWRLFYMVPEEIANKATNEFSSYIVFLSFSIIGVFLVCGIVAFVFVYKTRQKKFDLALTARDRMLDLLVTNTRNAFALLSAEKEAPLYISSNAGQIIGDTSFQIIHHGQGYQLKSHAEEGTSAIRQINEELGGWDGQTEFCSSFIPYSDGGAVRHFVMRIYPVEGDKNEFIAMAQDITQEREREETLKNALAMADSANGAKTRFLSNMSHDIRTPMNAIVNMTNFAIEAMDDKTAQLEYLNTIQDSADHLLRLINDILDVSRIESGQMFIDQKPFDMKKCLHDVCEIIAPLCMAKHLEFRVDYDGLKNCNLLGDKLKLSQVLINLLNNAVKFTPEHGTVRFTARELPSLKSEMISLRFEIADNGIGISAENMEHIFEPFIRADAAAIKKIEGSGLGLSICKSYVTALGGRLTCSSELNKGSTFTVELFFERDFHSSTVQTIPPEQQNISFDGKHALLCEDHKINQAIACKILQKIGFTVEVAADGDEGVTKFLSSPVGYYDIIYMDIQMPVMTGYEAAAAIRASDHVQAQTIPIIAMTANVFAEDVEKARAAEMNGHIAKPIVMQNLISETRKVL